MNLDDLESQAQGQAEEAKVSVELAQDIFSLWTVSILQGKANARLISFYALITLFLQFLILTSILVDLMPGLRKPEFTENTLVEVDVPSRYAKCANFSWRTSGQPLHVCSEMNGSLPWLVRDGDMKYNVFSPNSEEDAFFDGVSWFAPKAAAASMDEGAAKWWNVNKTHTLYHTHVKTFRKSWTTTMCRLLAMGLLSLILGREWMDIFLVIRIASRHFDRPRSRVLHHHDRVCVTWCDVVCVCNRMCVCVSVQPDDSSNPEDNDVLTEETYCLPVEQVFGAVTYFEKYPHRAFT
jgi:hypothetical protein